MLCPTSSVCAVMILAWHCASAQSNRPLASSETAGLWFPLNEQGNHLREQGHCRQAIPVLLRARSSAMKELGSNHVSTAIPTNNLAAAYLCLGEFNHAERHFRDALALLDGDRSSEMKAGILNNLGILLMSLTRTKDAEEILYQSLSITEAVHGAHHPATAIAVTSLGVLSLDAGEYTKARDLFRRSLAIWEASLGNHLDTATALNNLGVANLYLRDYEQARDLTARALDLRRRLLPPRHPDVAQSLYNHAVALDRLGQRKAARSAFHQAAAIRSAFASENVLGLTVDLRVLDKR
jgi:tetratricopeptide (TPR) repeat protein